MPPAGTYTMPKDKIAKDEKNTPKSPIKTNCRSAPVRKHVAGSTRERTVVLSVLLRPTLRQKVCPYHFYVGLIGGSSPAPKL